MSIVYNPHDLFCVQRNSTSSSFEEKVLSSAPNSLFFFDSASKIVALPSSSISSGTALSSSYSATSSFALNVPITSSYALFAESSSFSPGSVSSSHAVTADSASFVVFSNAIDTYVPIWQNKQLTTSSAIHIVNGKYVSVNSASYTIDPANTPALYVKQLDPDNFNAARFEGNINENYFQVVAQNLGTGAAASTDIIASSDIGISNNNYIDFGINASTYNVPSFNITKNSDGYLYVSSGSLAIGTSHPGYMTKFFVGGTTSDKEKGRITETSGFQITGSLEGTASRATTSSYALSSSYAVTSSYANQTSNAISSSNAITASYAVDTPASVSSSHAIISDSASYINPGATLFVVSGSNNIPPAYIEPYDYSLDNVYRPPSKEGRTFWDHKWVNWKVWQDTNYSNSTASALNINLGRETCIPVHNPSNVTLTRLTPVYISGSQTSSIYPFNQNWPTTYKADVYTAEADGTNTKSNVVGLVRNTIPPYHDGYVITNGIMHNADVSALGPIGTELYLASPEGTVAYGITNVEPGQPYESVFLGWVSEVGTGGGTQGSVVVKISKNPTPANAYAGITSDIIITNNLSGSVYISTGSVNLFADSTGYGVATGYSLAETTLSLTSGSTNYIVVEASQSLAIYKNTTDATYANGISIVRVATLDIYNETTSSWDVHQFNIGIIGLALANRINNKDIRLYGYQHELGLTLYTTGSSGSFGITEGTIWYGPNSHIVPAYEVGTGWEDFYTYMFHTTQSNGTSSWQQHTSSIFLSGYYDSGSSGMVPCGPGSWSVNFIYRLIGTTDEAAIVLSDAQYSTELEASNNATTPPNLPSTIRDIGLLVGRFIVQSGSYIPTIESAFVNQFISSVVTDHESLVGLQGGQGGEHKHLTATEYAGTGTGVFVKTNSPTLITPTFTSATPGHVPYWNSQQQLVLTSSVIHIVLDEYVLINSGSVPDPTNPETLLAFQKNTSSANNIGAYSNVNGFSQIYNQNFNTGSEASADIIAANDNGNQYVHYIDMGIASTTYDSPSWPWNKPNEGYLLMDGGNLWIGTTTTHSITFFFNNTASTNYADSTGFYLSGSWFGTSSWAKSSSWSPNQGATTLYTASTYQITSSWTNNVISSSYAETSSYARGIPIIKSGIVNGSLFGSDPKTSSIIFTKPFPDNNYSVTITGESSRTWTIQSKVSGNFVINSNNNTAFSNNVFWQAIQTGEYY